MIEATPQTQQSQEYDRPNFRQAGKEKSGKLLKGFIQDPVGKGTVSSIPYKFETILYKNPNKRGFGASAQRFFASEDMQPGPGQYDATSTGFKYQGNPSFSKKGLGNGFISKSSRMLYTGFANTGPGPGHYNVVEKPFKITHVKPEPSTVNTSRTASTDVTIKKSTIQFPGPGHYKSEQIKTSQNTNAKAVTSAFRSLTKRYSSSLSTINPPPGAYDIDRNINSKKPFKHFFGTSNFMLPTTKKKNDEEQKKDQCNNLLGKEDPRKVQSPGPGTYYNQTDELVQVSHSLQERKQANFIQGNQTRFGDIVQKKAHKTPNPGPGTYIPVLAENYGEKTLVTGSAFMSETARNPFNINNQYVGPTRYHPELVPRKSYHLNNNKKWI